MKLWRENKIDQEWEAPDEEIVKGYAEWAPTHPSSRPTDMHVGLFIAGKDGLNSAWEPADLEAFFDRRWSDLRDARFPREGAS